MSQNVKTETVGPTDAGETASHGVPGTKAVQAPDLSSHEAAERWIAAGRPSLAEMEPSGKDGGYTVADVKKAEG